MFLKCAILWRTLFHRNTHTQNILKWYLPKYEGGGGVEEKEYITKSKTKQFVYVMRNDTVKNKYTSCSYLGKIQAILHNIVTAKKPMA